jgi:hypothetical protein
LVVGSGDFWMFLDSVQIVRHRQESTTNAPETIRTAMEDTELDADAAIAQKYPPQLRAVLTAIRM